MKEFIKTLKVYWSIKTPIGSLRFLVYYITLFILFVSLPVQPVSIILWDYSIWGALLIQFFVLFLGLEIIKMLEREGIK
jgi:hypothetical protein